MNFKEHFKLTFAIMICTTVLIFASVGIAHLLMEALGAVAGGMATMMVLGVIWSAALSYALCGQSPFIAHDPPQKDEGP